MTYDPNSIVDTLKSTGQASDFASRAKLAAEKGITGYTGTAEQNTKLLGLIKQPAVPTVTPSVQTSDAATLAAKAAEEKLKSVTNSQITYVDQAFADTHDMNNPAYANYRVRPTTTTETTKPKSALAGVLGGEQANMVESKIKDLDTSLDETKKSIDAMLTNMTADIDSQTAALVDNIKNIYAGRIDDQKKVNQAMIGSTNVSGLRSGRTRYASTIQDSILSAEESAGLKRINDLNNEMMNLVNTAKNAASEKKSELVFKTMDQYDKAKKAHDDAVQNQYKMAMDLEKLAIDQSQEHRQQIKDELANMESTAKNLVTGIVDLPEKEILASIKDLSKSYGVDENYLMAAVNNLKQERLKSTSTDIKDWEYMKQNYGYTGSLQQYQQSKTNAKRVASGGGGTLTPQEADSLGISRKYVGMTDLGMINELNQSTPPGWFIDMVKEQEGVVLSPEGSVSVWEKFRGSPEMLIYRSQSYKPNTKDEVYGSSSDSSEYD